MDLKAALFAALELERDGRDFYARASQRVSDPETAEWFAAMAQEELEHMRMLNFEYYNVTKRGTFVAYAEAAASIAGREFDLPRLYPELAEGESVCLVCGSPLEKEGCGVCGAVAMGGSADVDTILALAIDAEKRTISYYQRLADSVEDEEGKRFFATFVDLEKDHLRELEKGR